MVDFLRLGVVAMPVIGDHNLLELGLIEFGAVKYIEEVFRLSHRNTLWAPLVTVGTLLGIPGHSDTGPESWFAIANSVCCG